ncbi:MAG: serine acetyltransferase [Oscillospiraceae bacterium]|jgi:serine O-acetyltransferase|nr:serine acetyltransferase [Oscillospiraceae bacterium]
MNINKLFDLNTYKLNLMKYKKLIEEDAFALSTFGDGNGSLSKSQKKTVEYKAVRLLRFYQVNKKNIWGQISKILIRSYNNKYGLDFYNNMSIDRGFVVGHWGRIIINCNTKIGKQFMVTHGVTIGRDVRGKRKGFPTIGDKVCIRTNSTVVGNITIGNNVLIAPNTFVNFDVPSDSIVIGNPAKIIPKENASEGHVGRLPNE